MSDDNRWNGYEGRKKLAVGIWEGLLFVAIAIIVHGC